MRGELTYGGEGHVKTETENGVLLPQDKEPIELPEAGQVKRRFPPRAFGGNMALPTPSLWTSGLQNCKGINFCCFWPKIIHLEGSKAMTEIQTL